MNLSKLFYMLSRTTRDVEVLTGRSGPARLGKRVLRRTVRRTVTGPAADQVWKEVPPKVG